MAKAATKLGDQPDTNTPTHYRVTVRDIFFAHNEMFRPGDRYTVTADIYNGDAGGQPFKDRCATATPIVKRH